MRSHDSRFRLSGVAWLGEVPEHWEMRRLAHSVRRSDRKLESEDVNGLPYVGLENVESWTGSILPVDLPAMSDGLVNSFSRGNVLFGKLRPYLAKAFSADFDGICSGEFLVLDPIDYDRRFLLHVLLAEGFVSLVDSSTYGAKMPRANWDFVGESLLPVPPLDEQRAIAAFLDRETERIDALVEKKRLLIERLEEYRTALITRTVTRGLPPEAARAAGLDPSPRMKPSGVEWLGDVPEHWEATRLSRVITCLDGRRIPLNAEQRGDFQGEFPYWGANGVLDYVAGWLFDEPLVLLGEDGAPFFDANKRIAFSVSGRIWVNNHAHVLRPTGMHPEFLAHVLNVTEFAFFIDGSTRDKLTQGQMNSIPVPVPPLNEQREISDFLHQEAGKVDCLVERVEANIERLQEHRTALITAAVTGKIDVREAAQAPVAAMLA